MINVNHNPHASPPTATAINSNSAFSFISRSWRDVCDSAESDLKLMKNRANSFKNLATSFDREIENFLHYAPSFSAIRSPKSPHAELEFVKKLKPKLSKIRTAYSCPDFGKKVMDKWRPRARIQIDTSAIRNAIVSEVEEECSRRGSRGKVRCRETWGGEEKQRRSNKDWEPFRALSARWRSLDYKTSESFPAEIFEGFRNSEFFEKVKSSLKAIRKEPQDSKEVPPLDATELLAYFVRQSGPFWGQIGVKKDVCDKIVERLCSKCKNQALLRSAFAGESSPYEGDSIDDELDKRVASVLKSTGHCHDGGFWDGTAKHDKPNEKRHVAIVTTASLPWMTGTAVNPLLRAAYLAKSEKQIITLLVPWLCKSDQELVYPDNLTFNSPKEQEAYIRNWLEERVGFKANFKISFYPGKFSKERRSIIPTGDTSRFVQSKYADIAILEEPEHLNWYHHGKRWTDKFNHVVGIVHTNYLEYIKREKYGAFQAFLVKHINNWVTRAYCHKVLRLSAATQDMPKSVVCNVHGVNPKFLKIGEVVAAERENGQQAFSKGAYFLGKMVWAKGYRELIDLLAKHNKDLDGFKLDVFGNGEDAREVQSVASKLDLNLNFLKGRDHADDSLHGYKLFINPSVSDVLSTATAEALAMGKFVICADHPSNEFFRSFPNCLTYKTSEDFVAKVKEALASVPQPLTSEERYKLSWEAATERFMEYSELDKLLCEGGNGSSELSKKMASVPSLSEMVDGGIAFAHYLLTGNELFRLCTGAIPGSRDYDKQHCRDLHLLPTQVENPIFGW